MLITRYNVHSQAQLRENKNLFLTKKKEQAGIHIQAYIYLKG